MEPCLFIGKSHVIVGCQMVTRIGGQRAFSLSKLLILILVSNLYIKWSYFWISDGFVYTQGGGGHLCLFLAKFIDFVKVLLNIRWCCEQGGRHAFSLLMPCSQNAAWMPAQIIRLIRQLAVADTRKGISIKHGMSWSFANINLPIFGYLFNITARLYEGWLKITFVKKLCCSYWLTIIILHWHVKNISHSFQNGVDYNG